MIQIQKWCRIGIFFIAIVSTAGCSHGLKGKISDGANVPLGAHDFTKYVADRYCRYLEIRSLLNGEKSPAELMAEKKGELCGVSKGSVGVPDTEVELLQFLGSGYAYVDLQCEVYFDNLHKFYKTKREEQSLTNILTGALSGLLGAIQASAKSIALVAVGGTSASATIENFGSSLLFELDPSATQGLVLKAQKEFQKQIASQNVTNSFPETLSAVSEYARLCMPPRIEKLVNEAVRSAKPSDLSSSQTSGTASNKIKLDSVSFILGLSRQLTNDEGYLLFALLVSTRPDDADTIELIKAKLSADLQLSLFENGSIKATSSTVIAARSILSSMDEDFRGQSAKALASLKPTEVVSNEADAVGGKNTESPENANQAFIAIAKEVLNLEDFSAQKILPLSVALSNDFEKLSTPTKAKINSDLGEDIVKKISGKEKLWDANTLIVALRNVPDIDAKAKIYLEKLRQDLAAPTVKRIKNKIQPLPNIGVQ